MPPEQMLDFKTVTPSADLYATAATLYYLISGQFIYNQVTDGGDLIRTLLEEPPVPGRRAEGTTSPPDWPPCSRSASPAIRTSSYPTAAALRLALRPFC